MTKNILVVDENGKKYGTTYLKRAKGLIKQGRARFLAHNMLCLACPPEKTLEDKNMSDWTMEHKTDETGSAANSASADAQPAQNKYSVEYCMEQVALIGKQTDYLYQVIEQLQNMDNGEANDQKAMALGNIVESRENTNQQMLLFYMKICDSLKPPATVDTTLQKAKLQEQLLHIMDKTLENGEFSSSEITDMFNGAFDAIRHIAD